jgi:hypothetical protein
MRKQILPRHAYWVEARRQHYGDGYVWVAGHWR